MYSLLLCPVCGGTLLRQSGTLRCAQGHSFDLAKEGYVNLLSGKGGSQHGDNTMMIKARRRFLDAGHYSPLAKVYAEALRAHLKEGAYQIDVGCGEGYYTAYAHAVTKEKQGKTIAFDVSKDAVRLAAKRNAADLLFVGSAYRVPLADGCAEGISLLFSPFCREEILRLLGKDGLLFMAYPTERHLYGLKAAIYDTPYLNEPTDAAIKGFRLLDKQDVNYDLTLHEKEDIEALFAMTPYYYKTGKEGHARLASLTVLKTEVAFRLAVYQKE